jgi:hypothetical protein
VRQLDPSAALRSAACAVALLASAEPASAGVTFPRFRNIQVPAPRYGLPHIDNVQFSGGSTGITATIGGLNFGAAPPDVPCTACTPLEVQVLDIAADGTQQTINVTAWSDTSITLTGIVANPGDAFEIDVYNDTVGNAAAWGGLISRDKAAPKIKSIQTSGSGQALTVTVNGAGFGPAPAEVGQNTTSPYFIFSDVNNASTGYGGERWNAGFCGTYECDGVSMGYVSWTDTQIVMSTFGSEYGQEDWFINPQDAFCVAVWPSTSNSNGTTGGTAKCSRLAK